MYRLQDKIRSKARIHGLPRTLRRWTSPPYRGGLQRCHVSSGSGPHLPAEVGFGTATCHEALDLASLLGRASVLHMSYGSSSTMRHVVSYGSRASSIKKGLAGLPMQLGPCVSKALSHVSKAPGA
jgi:hypothetical protein